MTVRASKPSLNLREALSELNKPSGVAGEAMLRAETPQEQFNLIGAGRKNLIINGGFDVWQRGTSSTAKDQYLADRWKVNWYSVGSVSVTKQSTGMEEFPNCIRVQRPSGETSTNDLDLIQTLESVNSAYVAGKHLTVSFWARVGSDYSGTTMRVVPIYGNGTDDYINYDYFATNRVSGYVNGGDRRNFTPTTEWQYFSFTSFAPLETNQLGLAFCANDQTGTAGANDYYEITGVQLELGSVATPFEHRSYGEELALCQRYYQKDVFNPYYGFMPTGGDTYRHWKLNLPVAMRTTATLTITADAVIITNYITAQALAFRQSVGNSTSAKNITSYILDAEL